MGSWAKIKLANACQIKKGEQLNKLALESAGDYPCINGGIEPSGYTHKWNRPENTITISEGGNSCGYVNYLKTKFWSGGHCYSLMEIKQGIDERFLYQSLKGKESIIMRLRVGSGLPNIQQKAIKEFELDFPKDKPEQTRIAEILSTADEAIAHTEALIAKYQRIKTGLMQDLLTRGIDEHGNLRSEATHKFVVKNGIKVPEEWEVETLGVLCNRGFGSIQTGPFGSQLHAEDYKKEGIPIITVEHLNDNRISHNNLPLVGSEDYQRLIKYVLNTGDLVFSRVGSIDRCSITTVAENGWMFSGRCLRVRPGKYFDPFFLMYQLNFDIAKNYILANAVGSTMKCLNTEILSNTPIFRPSLKEQKNISIRILDFEDSIQELTTLLSKFHSLKTGLMQDLLSGRVRVKIKEKEEVCR